MCILLKPYLTLSRSILPSQEVFPLWEINLIKKGKMQRVFVLDKNKYRYCRLLQKNDGYNYNNLENKITTGEVQNISSPT